MLSDLKTVDPQLLLTVNSDIGCHMTLRDLQKWHPGIKLFMTHQCSISSEKIKVTQYALSCRIMASLYRGRV